MNNFKRLFAFGGATTSANDSSAKCTTCSKKIAGGTGGISMGGIDVIEAALARHIFRCKSCGAVYCSECGLSAKWECGKCGGEIGD